ncbi:MAG: carbon-nitrogen hydrolase family protein [Planctomycetes bacterium]|nr:carbon-nitrogen hydrolase family protein [Planctomycetota bacterium]NOG53928.1 carbon-nitrogen hydrolase family protein [Planctomycetota bacterium]
MKHIHSTRVASLLCLAVLLLAGGLRIHSQPQDQVDGDSHSVRVAVCQTLCIDSDREGNLRRITYALETAAADGAQIACFPETAILGWVNPEAHDLADPIPGKTSDELAALAKQHGLMICIGLCEKSDGNLYDSVILIGSDGQILAKHRKVNILTELMDPPYTPGNPYAIPVVDTPIGRVGMLICADTFKDELVQTIKSKSADLLLVPYGWAAMREQWPEHGKNLEAWVISTAKRAGCPVVGTDVVGAISSGPWQGMTYGGQSVVVATDGTVIGTLRDRDVDVQTFDVPLGSAISQDDRP